jgi:thiamine-monophosphate kinase
MPPGPLQPSSRPQNDSSDLCDEQRVIDLVSATFCAGAECGADIAFGVGDDAAVLRVPGSAELLLVAIDAIVAGTHFTLDDDLARVGWKAVAVNVSDIAAMGGRPTHAVLSVTVPRTLPFTRVSELLEGIARAADHWHCAVIGGDTVGGPALSVSLTVLGRVAPEHVCYRHGARPGDRLAVTGPLGGSLASGRHLDVQARLAEAQWLVSHCKPSAMIDLSDGLARDATRVARAGNVQLCLDAKAVPLADRCTIEQALFDGEDFELLCAFPPGALSAAQRDAFAAACGRPLHVIGRVCAGTPSVLLDGQSLPDGGFDHFADQC